MRDNDPDIFSCRNLFKMQIRNKLIHIFRRYIYMYLLLVLVDITSMEHDWLYLKDRALILMGDGEFV